MTRVANGWPRGHPFQRHNKAMLVDANGYLLELELDIVLTPVCAGMLADPGDGWPRGAGAGCANAKVLAGLHAMIPDLTPRACRPDP